MSATGRMHRERVRRTLTFWLRPEFVLRVLNRFQKVAGFDRAVALASGALTAMIPLIIVTGSLSSQLGGKDTAQRIIDRYDLTGSGAQAVQDVFAPPSGTSASLGVVGFLFLILAVLSFSRAMQRLFEQTWELEALSVRNSINGLLWIGGLALYLVLNGALHALLDMAAPNSSRPSSPHPCPRCSSRGAAGSSALGESRVAISFRSQRSARSCSRGTR